MNVKNSLFSSFAFVTLTLLLSGCGVGSSNSVSKKPSVVGNIEENLSWYSAIDINKSIRMNVVVPTPNDYKCVPYYDLTAPPRPCTIEDVNHDNSAYDDYIPEVHVILSTDDFPSDTPNASMKQKGKSTRHAKQASFRIKLDSKTHLYDGERTFQLNKSPYDKTRMKDKLWFDTFIEVPNFTSIRTRFINLVVNGEDYGMFTHVEYLGKEFLLHRGWNIDDNLYKIQNFAFFFTKGLTLDAKGKPLYPKLFDALMEQKRGKDTAKLVEMVKQLNAVYRDPVKFSKFFKKYFNRENYLTWVAINIIVSNKDTVTQNFYLFNPKNSDTFYFLPWDYDGAGSEEKKLTKWQHSIGFLWGIPLHKGFFSIKKNREDLEKKIAYLRANYFTDKKIQARVDVYSKIVGPFIQKSPDGDHLRYQVWKDAVADIVPHLSRNLKRYYEERNAPMPFWEGAKYSDGVLHLNWERSVDFNGNTILYNVKVARDLNMTDIVLQDVNISDTPATDNPYGIEYSKNIDLASGKYYLQVIAFEENNVSNYQIAFDMVYDTNHQRHYGILAFDVQ